MGDRTFCGSSLPNGLHRFQKLDASHQRQKADVGHEKNMTPSDLVELLVKEMAERGMVCRHHPILRA